MTLATINAARALIAQEIIEGLPRSIRPEDLRAVMNKILDVVAESDHTAVSETVLQAATLVTTAAASLTDTMAGHLAASDPHPQYLTQTEGDGRYVQPAAVTSAVDVAVAALVGAAPSTLDTLSEIAIAIADDQAASTAMTALIGTKASQSAIDALILPASGSVSQAYADRASMVVRSGQTVALPCNPTTGDNLQSMAQWASAAHYVEEGGALYLQIADGLHNVSTYLDITDGRRLDIRATAVPDFLIVTGATFSGTTGP